MRVERRRFLAGLGAGAAAGPVLWSKEAEKPACLGGKPVRKKPFSSWPVVGEKDVEAWVAALKSRRWCRIGGHRVSAFEKAFAQLLGARYCVATTNGTNALFTAINVLDIGPGDEVIVPPYTFVATVNAVVLRYALPIFVDTDRRSFQIDARKIERAITERTRCILPVHLGGLPADMDTILSVARKHNLPVVEDACQAHLAQWRGKCVGTLGTIGCFSFQETKNLASGEGGMFITNDEKLYELAWSFNTNGRARRGRYGFAYPFPGSNVRMTEYQGALLLAQMTRLREQTERRTRNAAYLTEMLNQIPGIHPAQPYPGTTRNAYHLYMFRYDSEAFAGLSRNGFLKALRAEGVPCSGGYRPLNKEPFLKRCFESRGYRRIYGPNLYKRWLERNQCPENDKLCDEGVWFFQALLLGEKRDMEDIAEAIVKTKRNARLLAKRV